MDLSRRFASRIRAPFSATHSYSPFYKEGDVEGVGTIQDQPMDEFDRQFLTEQSSQPVPLRYSLPSQSRQLTDYNHSRRALRDDLFDVYHDAPIDSSPTFTISSPTTSILQNKSQAIKRPRHSASGPYKSLPRASRNNTVQSIPPCEVRSVNSAPILDLPHATPIIQGIPLVPTDKLPDHLRSVFEFELFNAVQSKCFSPAFESNDNMVLSAPTGSGKTVIMELALCRLLTMSKNQDFKAIYQAPTKSLCQERCRDWSKKFNTLGLKCAELTGDVEHSHLKTVQSAHIIVTTPEKWDSITRKWRDNARLMQMIQLFLVDEVHMLNESRGATLEAVVSRMKSAGSGVRFIALSATVPNSDDISTWLGRNPTAQHLPACREVFDESFRPVKLDKHVVGFRCRPNDFALDSILTKEIPTFIARYANRKPVMIFCVSKKSAIKTANTLADLWMSTVTHLRLWNSPRQRFNVTNLELQKLLSAGVAFHHGALDAADRRAVEQGFLSGDVNIICSTSTLAVGVNLPCYLVILKGTSCWSDSGLQEYSSLEVMQMLGRAGRPQYETSACAVILTHSDKVRRYENMVSSQEVLESSLHKNLVEHLNAEIGIGTIHDGQSAHKWLASSFLSVRLRRNPSYYHLQEHVATNDADQLLEQICERDLKLLENTRLIEYHGSDLRCTDYGDAMARYYVQYDSMVVFLKMSQKPKVSEILTVLAQAHEFCDLKIRSGEKSMYKTINKANDIRYPIKVDIALPAHKTSLIIQAHLGGVVLEKSNMSQTGQFKQDSLTVLNHCNRLIRCMIDIQIHRKDATAVKNALELCRSIAAGVWDNTAMQLKQIESVGDVTARKLAAAGIKDIDTLMNTEPHRIETVLGKSQPFGYNLLKKAAKFPNLRISVKVVDRTRKGLCGEVEVRLNCEIGYLNDCLPLYFNRKAVYVCFLCETSDGKLVDFRRFDVRRLKDGEKILLIVSLEQQCTYINCHVMCDAIAGTHRYVELKLDIPDAWFSGATIHQKPNDFVNRTPDIPRSYLPDSFDDASLADDDFLAAELALDQVDVIEGDLDEVIDAQTKRDNFTSDLKCKTTTSDNGPTQNAPQKDYRVPKRLVNGNWTCQHTCSDEGKECKHQCCKEGVKRPKKRAKTQAMTFGPADTMEDAFARLSDNAKDLKGVEILDIDDILSRTGKYRKSSDTHQKVALTDDSHAPYQASQSKTTSLLDHGDIRDNSELESDDLPYANALVSHSGCSQINPSNRLNERYQENDQDCTFDVDDDDMDVMDCDWFEADTAAPRLCVEVAETAADALPKDFLPKPDSNSNVFDTKATPESTEAVRNHMLCVRPEKIAPLSRGSSYDETNGDTFDNVNHVDGIDDTSVTALDEAYSKRPSSTVDHVPQGQEFSHTRDQAILEPGKHVKLVVTDPKHRAPWERQRELHEEEQKKKWAKFPVWMYEEFGAYVDII